MAGTSSADRLKEAAEHGTLPPYVLYQRKVSGYEIPSASPIQVMAKYYVKGSSRGVYKQRPACRNRKIVGENHISTTYSPFSKLIRLHLFLLCSCLHPVLLHCWFPLLLLRLQVCQFSWFHCQSKAVCVIWIYLREADKKNPFQSWSAIWEDDARKCARVLCVVTSWVDPLMVEYYGITVKLIGELLCSHGVLRVRKHGHTDSHMNDAPQIAWKIHRHWRWMIFTYQNNPKIDLC